ncbi:hypothetical protein LMH87_004181 [Akanthomyces muscarius]|uniref:Rhodopsin domain-containing protein n=1 Tax=Akanthomyces muscarius TaxID=2231603 RepID=A0A9W8Q2T7_AKAMU|nr:hypothetical protein LMH87_004181 [Akanthomyces muscarius]KAJ4145326.1 hypothetical protein LMH87_004181 [Akanthomyces muscarius]
MDENRASWLTAPMGMFLAWSASTFLIRAWAKLRTKTWGLDDYCLSLSLATIVVHVACTYRAIHFGYGKPLAAIEPEHRPILEKLLYITEFLYVLAQGLCRASASLFISHMAQSGPQTRPARALAGVSGVWTAASALAIAIRGNIGRPWSTLDGTQPLFTRWLSIEITGVVIELSIWLLAAHLVWSLQMTLRKRIYILGAFGVKLLLIVFIGFRLKYLAPARNWDPTLTSIVPSIFTQAVLHFSIIASCVTTLKPFLRHFDPTYVLESADVSSSKRSRTSTTNPSRDPYYRLGTMNRPNRSRDDPNDNINWRPYQGPTQSDRYAKAYHDSTATQSSQSSKEGTLSRLARTISTSLGSGTQSKQSSATRSNHIGDTASMRTDASDRIIIERTTEVSVEHEDSPAERASQKGGV